MTIHQSSDHPNYLFSEAKDIFDINLLLSASGLFILMKQYNDSSDITESIVPWISELESLGIKSKKLNELNDVYEVKNLVENIKQTFYQDFKSSYQRE